MDEPPLNLRAVTTDGYLEITWDEGHVGLYPFLLLRGECPCAGCVDEHTGVRRLDRTTIPDDIVIKGMELVGHYALKIDWSDGHSTGIYTWKRLRALCPCPKCKRKA
jgi:DUF971 family protein